MERMNVYEVTLKSNCYNHGYDVKVTSKTLEEAISKAKKYLEEDIGNIYIEVIAIKELIKNVKV